MRFGENPNKVFMFEPLEKPLKMGRSSYSIMELPISVWNTVMRWWVLSAHGNLEDLLLSGRKSLGVSIDQLQNFLISKRLVFESLVPNWCGFDCSIYLGFYEFFADYIFWVVRDFIEWICNYVRITSIMKFVLDVNEIKLVLRMHYEGGKKECTIGGIR